MKGHKQNCWEDRESLRIGGSRRISKMDHPRLCPRPVVCLHHGSAKRAGKTEEPGEAWGGESRDERGKTNEKQQTAFCDRGAKFQRLSQHLEALKRS